ncbi:hypothetical protein [Streptomyces sp. NPDC058401]|uniref:hypothetical protein n=1 Tax=Streptomyces sp. NPDC058401 TaxID=3346480 RepID=UPI0036596639
MPTTTHTTRTTQTTTRTSETVQMTETTDAGPQPGTSRLLRVLTVLLALGGAIAVAALLVVRLAPSWADPIDAALTAFGAYATVAVPYLIWDRSVN